LSLAKRCFRPATKVRLRKSTITSRSISYKSNGKYQQYSSSTRAAPENQSILPLRKRIEPLPSPTPRSGKIGARRQPSPKKEERNELADEHACPRFGQRRGVAARVELAGRRFASLRLGGIENLSRQIARAAPPGLALRIDRRRRYAGSKRRRSKTAA